MSAHIEVEQRGPLTKVDFERVQNFLRENGTFKEQKDRVFIDYAESFTQSTVSTRDRDIRLRVTNGVPEIIIKLGRWGSNEQRRELSALSPGTPFDVLVEMFAALGQTKGILGVRKMQVWEWDGIEFALVEVPGHSFYFEAELIAHSKEEAAAAMKKIDAACAKLKLDIFSEKEFFDYIDLLNKESNEVFDAEKIAPDYFKKRFSLT